MSSPGSESGFTLTELLLGVSLLSWVGMTMATVRDAGSGPGGYVLALGLSLSFSVASLWAFLKAAKAAAARVPDSVLTSVLFLLIWIVYSFIGTVLLRRLTQVLV